MKIFSILSSTLLLAASAGFVGCAVEAASGEDGGSDQAVVESGLRTLAEVDLGYGYLIFQEATGLDGNPVTSVLEISPNDYASTPFSDLASGNHTTLELFRAVAPDQEAPQALIDSHELEATLLERESLDVVVPAFDRDAPIEKTTTACKNFVTPSTSCFYYTAIADKNVSSGSGSLYLNNSSSYTTQKDVNLGLCNESNQSIYVRMKYGDYAYPYAMHTFASGYVPAGMKGAVYGRNYWDFSTNPRYQVTGTPLMPWISAPHGLRAAERNSVCGGPRPR